ncbi:MAG: RNA methyltransferase [Planctomycetota bacterium]|nr:RNA methyltransferase [Planctomycetales bacterium]RLS45369.1 MAG: RNA methyltransferase [Planctomycetota bacterium]
MRNEELAVCGLSAVRSRFEKKPNSIRRLFFDEATAPCVGNICSALATAKKIYRCVEPAELEKISGSIHHGGIVAVVDRPVLKSPHPDELREWGRLREPVLLLDCISNGHNLGAIIRTAAFFGVTKLILPDHPSAALPTEATYRVAEGGLDHVEVFQVKRLDLFAHELRKYYTVIGADTRGGHPDLDVSGYKPIALVMGNEEHGLADEVAAACDRLVTIPGSGRVESLNVSAAAAVLLWECTRSLRQAR